MTEKILSYLFFTGSLGYLWCANSLSFGVLSSPKAGFLPTIAGVGAVILAGFIIVSSHFDADAEPINWRKFTLITAGIVFYLICLAMTGYIIATFLTMLYLLKCMEMQGWFFPGFISAIVAISFYVLFSTLLGITLP